MSEYIVLCEEHYNPLGIVRSLGEEGIKSIAVVVKSTDRLVSKSKYLKELHLVTSLKEGLDFVLDNYGKQEKDFLLLSDDVAMSLVDSRYDEIKNRFITFNAGKPGVINYYLKKENIQKLASECGFKIPKTIIINKGEKIPTDIKYPIITKAISSITGGWKNDVFICKNDEELIEALPKIKSEVIALQEYLVKDNELCLDGFSYDQGKQVFISIASNYDYLIDGSYSPLMTIKNFDEVENYETIQIGLNKMFEKIGFDGIFSVEFLVVGKELYFLEINFRNSTWSYASTKCGMNLPLLWTKAMSNGCLSENPYRKIKPDYHAMAEYVDFTYRVTKKRISLSKWLKERKACDCLFFKNKLDNKPYYSLIIGRVLHKLKLRK